MMSEPRDPAIKIFGAAIAPSTDPVADGKNVNGEVENIEVDARMSDAPKELDQNESSNSSGLSNCNEDDHHISIGDANAEQDRAETDTSNQEKLLKKPDKILPCPRCNSVDTKFCYFNNYNVNQPRYFCKNCNRYWTAGGSMRNVPVGAGKRKSKLSVTHHHHLMMASDAMPCSRVDASNLVAQQVLLGASSAHVRPFKENGIVLKHSPIAPLCASKSSKQITTELMRSCRENKEQTCISSVSDSRHLEDDRVEIQNGHIANQDCHTGLSPMHLPYYHGPPFVYPWGPGCSNASAMAAGQCSSDLFNVPGIDNQSPGSWNQPPIFAAPFCSPTIAFPFMPTPFWGFPSWPTGTWNLPWLGSQDHLSPLFSTSKSDSAKNSSPTLGKHSRDISLEGEEQRPTKSLWVPKTLRIADPDEAAKSSIWATLGIKPGASIHKGSVFKAFQPKNGTKQQTADAIQVLHANPVALCRSQTFQEST